MKNTTQTKGQMKNEPAKGKMNESTQGTHTNTQKQGSESMNDRKKNGHNMK